MSRVAKTYEQRKLDRLLLEASKNGDCNRIEELLKAGANIEGIRYGYRGTSLHVAIKHNKHRAVKLLLRCGADIDYADNFDGNNALQKAIRYNLEDMALFLLKNDANIESKNKKGDTPLSQAIGKENIRMVQMLIESKADITNIHPDKYLKLILILDKLTTSYVNASRSLLYYPEKVSYSSNLARPSKFLKTFQEFSLANDHDAKFLDEKHRKNLLQLAKDMTINFATARNNFVKIANNFVESGEERLVDRFLLKNNIYFINMNYLIGPKKEQEQKLSKITPPPYTSPIEKSTIVTIKSLNRHEYH